MKRGYIGERNVKDSPTVPRSKNVKNRYTIDEALDVFIQSKEAEGLRPRSIENYREHTRHLMRYIDRNPFYIDEITSKLIREYITYLSKDRVAYEEFGKRARESKGLSPYTINLRLRSLKTMCAFWYEEGMLASNPAAKVRKVKADEVDEVPGLTDIEVERILNYFDERQFAQWRDKTLCLLLLDCGLRIEEAVSITIDRINLRYCEINIPANKAKNRKARDVPVSREVAKRLTWKFRLYF
ncbi:tyrosine-type recombinase/integrase [Bacillus benzoevorans]|uniref:Site-specific recombinase XerD n=1 Tax=Bacillus benzoevorans TaxID=1456 RepID=A0A7X0HUZ6_9BACI|nr:phage integrase SAM-like domain-containing protein [Bacillus benzoevorans]MBB6447382.1 site-specific recombinase XerD [Bacillus benzoevorans]